MDATTRTIHELLRIAAGLWLEQRPQYLRSSEHGELPGCYHDSDDEKWPSLAERVYGQVWKEQMDASGIPR
jgi:hypothetical protein